jgi:hypothetical protein
MSKVKMETLVTVEEQNRKVNNGKENQLTNLLRESQ